MLRKIFLKYFINTLETPERVEVPKEKKRRKNENVIKIWVLVFKNILYIIKSLFRR